jgi:hypothetical protein
VLLLTPQVVSHSNKGAESYVWGQMCDDWLLAFLRPLDRDPDDFSCSELYIKSGDQEVDIVPKVPFAGWGDLVPSGQDVGAKLHHTRSSDNLELSWLQSAIVYRFVHLVWRGDQLQWFWKNVLPRNVPEHCDYSDYYHRFPVPTQLCWHINQALHPVLRLKVQLR